jgi:hypothetical protein
VGQTRTAMRDEDDVDDDDDDDDGIVGVPPTGK